MRDIVDKVATAEELLAKDEDYSIVMNGQDTNSVKMQLKCFTPTESYWSVKYRLNESVYTALKDAGYLTPNMQVDVYEGERPAPRNPKKKGYLTPNMQVDVYEGERPEPRNPKKKS